MFTSLSSEHCDAVDKLNQAKQSLRHGQCGSLIPPRTQVVKSKSAGAEDGRGRFKTEANGPARISDRVKKAPLKT